MIEYLWSNGIKNAFSSIINFQLYRMMMHSWTSFLQYLYKRVGSLIFSRNYWIDVHILELEMINLLFWIIAIDIWHRKIWTFILAWWRKKIISFSYPCVCLAKTGWSQGKINASNIFPEVYSTYKMPPPIPKNYLHHQLILLLMQVRKKEKSCKPCDIYLPLY